MLFIIAQMIETSDLEWYENSSNWFSDLEEAEKVQMQRAACANSAAKFEQCKAQVIGELENCECTAEGLLDCGSVNNNGFAVYCALWGYDKSRDLFAE